MGHNKFGERRNKTEIFWKILNILDDRGGGRSFGFGSRDGGRDDRYGDRRRSPEQPKERPKLNLAPRTKPKVKILTWLTSHWCNVRKVFGSALECYGGNFFLASDWDILKAVLRIHFILVQIRILDAPWKWIQINFINNSRFTDFF